MKKAIIIIIMLSLCITGCESEQYQELEQEPMLTQITTSHVSPDNCFLCGDSTDRTPYWGQNNVGIISLNTFDVVPVMINNYRNDGELIKENNNCIRVKSFKNQENGFRANIFEDSDRGYARAAISLNDDEILNTDKMASHLCPACINAIYENTYTSAFGVGVINFDTREIRALDSCITGFTLGDYYINCDWKEQKSKNNTEEVNILIFYCPMRYIGKPE